MGLLDSVLGAGMQGKAQDFMQRYEQGAPHEGIDGGEALSHYAAVAPKLSRQDYELSAQEAFARMPADQRAEFARMLHQQTGGAGAPIPHDDPAAMARSLSEAREGRPGLVQSMFGGGGGGGGGLGGMLGGAGGGGLGGMLGGAGATASQGASILNSPVAKAALGGIAAIAMKRMMSRH